MIFIVHGENIPKSRETILQLQKKLNLHTKHEVNITETSAGNLLDLATSYDIFSEPPFVTLNISGTTKRNFDDYIDILTKIPAQTAVVIYSNKELTKANQFIKEASKIKAKTLLSSLQPTANVFKFIDALFAKNKKQAYMELNELILAGEDAFYAFTMVLYGLRTIAGAKFSSPGFVKAAPFVKAKAIKQAQNFTQHQILNLYKQCYDLDKMFKTGKISSDILIPYVIEKINE